MAERAYPREWFFIPEGSPESAPLPIPVRQLPASNLGVDPNLLLFGFGVLALLGFFGLIVFMKGK